MAYIKEYWTDKERRAEQARKHTKEMHNVYEQRIKESVRDTIKATIVEDVQSQYQINKDESVEEIINKLTDEMLKHAKNMEFEKAAELRDKIKELENLL